MAATPPPPSSDPTFDLERIVARLRRNGGALSAFVVLALAIGLGYTLIVPAKYEARTTLFFPVRIPSAIGQSGITDGSSAASLLGAAGPTPIKIFRAFLESQTALDYVSSHSGLERLKIVDVRNFSEDAGANMLTVSIVLPDGDQAKQLLAYHLEALRVINAKVSDTYVHDETATLQADLAREKRLLVEADRRFIRYEKVTGSAPTIGSSSSSMPVSINKWQEQLVKDQVELASVSAAIQNATRRFTAAVGQGGSEPIDIPPIKKWRPLLVDAEADLRLKRQALGEDAPDIRRLKEKIKGLQRSLQEELRRYLSSVNKGLLDPTDGGAASPTTPAEVTGMLLRQVELESEIKSLTPLSNVAPDEAGNLTKLARDVAIQSKLVETATISLETAKLLALRNPNKSYTLDPPRIMEKPVNKRFGQMTLISLAVGLLLGITWALNFGRRPD